MYMFMNKAKHLYFIKLKNVENYSYCILSAYTLQCIYVYTYIFSETNFISFGVSSRTIVNVRS